MFYRMIWFVIILFLFLPVVGIVFMWIRRKWSKAMRVSLTVLFGIYAATVIIFLAPSGGDEDKQITDNPSEDQEEIEKKEQQNQQDKHSAPIIDTSKGDVKNQYKEAFVNKLNAELLSIQGSFDQEPYAIELILRGNKKDTESATVKNMKTAIMDAVYLVKYSGPEVDDLEINMKYPQTNQNGLDENQFAIKSDFSGNTITELENRSETDIDNLNMMADSWWKHPVLND